MRIWKYRIGIVDIQSLKMPAGAEILKADKQNGDAFLWVMCNPDAPRSFRTIAIYGTGNPMPEEPGKYISTFQSFNDTVWHVFDLGEN